MFESDLSRWAQLRSIECSEAIGEGILTLVSYQPTAIAHKVVSCVCTDRPMQFN
jgi:hypothetical protein